MCGSDARDREPTPPLAGLELVALAEDDLDQVLEIERASFGRPWRREHFLHEIRENRWAVNQVARRGERVHGYSCVWRLHGELRINNFAVRAESRRLGLARWMLRRILGEARAAGCTVATLEVRESNLPARSLYGGEGFVEVGRREDYYRAEQEDAIVMEVPLVARPGEPGL